MNRDIAKLWIDALQSGDYRQTTGALCRTAKDGTKSYCCLGVLCELYQQHADVSLDVDTREDSATGTTLKLYNRLDDFLPQPVRVWAGMKTNDGEFGYPDPVYRHDNLVAINDDDADFDEMAELIKEYVNIL